MTSPLCPKCNNPMALKTKKGTSWQFWGCSMWSETKCNGFRNVEKTKVVKKVQDFSKVVGSNEQVAFWDTVKTTNNHLILRARAGTGKTFTATYMLSFLPDTLKIIFTAFAKDIATELESRVPDHIAASTIHSFAFKQVKRWNPKVQVNKDKVYDIINTLISDDDESKDFLTIAVKRLVDLSKYHLYDGTNEDQLMDLANKFGVELNDSTSQIFQLVKEVMKISKAQKHIVDFTDMLWFVYTYNIPVEQYDVFIADEMQDLNKLQQFVVFRAIEKGGRFVGVGDDRQAIFGFAGADVDSMENMISELGKSKRGVKVMPLTESRRSPQSHIAMAQSLVPDIKALDNAEIGSIEEITCDIAITKALSGDMLICRRNAPLIKVAYALIRSGKPAMVKGRDIGVGILALVKKLRSNSIVQLIEKAETYRANELAKLQAKGKKAESAIVTLNDKIDTLIALTEDVNDLTDLRVKINRLFADDNPAGKILLSSVHKAKGLEADNVFILDYAHIMLKMSQEWQQVQEKNLFYVALTRSKRKMYLVD